MCISLGMRAFEWTFIYENISAFCNQISLVFWNICLSSVHLDGNKTQFYSVYQNWYFSGGSEGEGMTNKYTIKCHLMLWIIQRLSYITWSERTSASCHVLLSTSTTTALKSMLKCKNIFVDGIYPGEEGYGQTVQDGDWVQLQCFRELFGTGTPRWVVILQLVVSIFALAIGIDGMS